MEIRPLKIHDDDEFHAAYTVMRAAYLFERENAPMWSEREAAVMFRHPETSETWHVYGAFEDEQVVGVALRLVTHLDNLDKTFVEVDVAPEHRRRGIGGALIEYLAERTREDGRRVMLMETHYAAERQEDHPYRRFAEKHGFALASTEISRVLEIPIEDARLQGWIDEAAAHHPTYTVEAYTDMLPDHLIESYCHVVNQLGVDAPTGDIEFEAEAMTPQLWRERLAKLKEQGRQLFYTVAVAPSQEVVAATVLAVPADDPGKVYQWATLVLREHRGHRLGLAIKARNLRELQRAHPQRRRIFTGNEQTNGPMVRINEQLGFRPVEVCAAFQRTLEAATAATATFTAASVTASETSAG